MSIHQIAAVLAAEDCPASLSTVAKVIREAGLARLPRRFAAVLADIIGPDAAPVADRRAFHFQAGMSNDNYDGHQRQLSCRTFARRFGRRGAGGTSSENASQRFCLRSTKRPVAMSPQICTPPLMHEPVQMMISVRAGRSLRTSSSDVIMRFGLRRPSAGISSPGQRNLGAQPIFAA